MWRKGLMWRALVDRIAAAFSAVVYDDAACAPTPPPQDVTASNAAVVEALGPDAMTLIPGVRVVVYSGSTVDQVQWLVGRVTKAAVVGATRAVNAIVIAYRGTDQLTDWLINLTLESKPIGDGTIGFHKKVARSFGAGWSFIVPLCV